MKNNKNNKGFTMVELIIVIAILAILMVALVPQFIKYVESARQSNDMQVATGIESAVEVAVIDPANKITLDSGDTIVVTWDTSGTGAITAKEGTATSAIEDDLEAVLGSLTIEPDSSLATDADYVLTVSYAAATGFSFDATWIAGMGDYTTTP